MFRNGSQPRGEGDATGGAARSPGSDVPQIAARAAAVEALRRSCLEQGCNLRELAQRAGVSRTTLHHLLCGVTRRPHVATIGRLARALGLGAEQLRPASAAPASARRVTGSGGAPNRAEARVEDVGDCAAFDRATNPAVHEVSRGEPELFAGWNRDEWDELYSTFGVGGHLSPEGVLECARAINERREATRQLQLVLETHLAEVARELVETLYRMVKDSPPSRRMMP